MPIGSPCIASKTLIKLEFMCSTSAADKSPSRGTGDRSPSLSNNPILVYTVFIHTPMHLDQSSHETFSLFDSFVLLLCCRLYQRRLARPNDLTRVAETRNKTRFRSRGIKPSRAHDHMLLERGCGLRVRFSQCLIPPNPRFEVLWRARPAADAPHDGKKLELTRGGLGCTARAG